MVIPLEVSALRAFHGPIEAVHGIDLEVGEGRCVALCSARMVPAKPRPCRRSRERCVPAVRSGSSARTLYRNRWRSASGAASPYRRRGGVSSPIFRSSTISFWAAHCSEDKARARAGHRRLVQPVSDLGRASTSARRHAVRRRAADAGDCSRAGVEAAHFAAGRAFIGISTTNHRGDLRHHPGSQVRWCHHPSGRAKCRRLRSRFPITSTS